MKFIIYLTAFIALSMPVCAQQNMVPNGDFEYYTTCPTGVTQISYANGWSSYVTSPDYFNACHTAGIAGVPVNAFGYQYAASGQAYIGLVGSRFSNGIDGEYITAAISPLTAGMVYETSMSVSMANTHSGATNGLGMLFYVNGASSLALLPGVQLRVPQVLYNRYGLITDTANWVRLKMAFMADSAYSHIAVGGFSNFSSFSYANQGGGSVTPYYYIDSIVVRQIKMLNLSVPDTLLCVGDTINVSYHVNVDNYFTSTNVFSAQLSSASGSFSSPLVIGSVISDTDGIIQCIIPTSLTASNGYKIRVVANSPVNVSSDTLSVSIGTPITGLSTTISSQPCIGSNVYMSASSTTPSATYKWAGPSGFTTIGPYASVPNAGPTNAGNYIVAAAFYGCRDYDTVTLTLNPLPAKPVAGSNTPVCNGNTLNLSASTSTGGVAYSWTGPNSFSAATQNPSLANATAIAAGNYIVTATITATGCSAKDTETVVISPIPAVTATSNAPLCDGATMSLYSSATPTGTFSWAGPGSFTSSAQNPAITNASPAASGDYIVSVTLNGCTGKDTTTVTVKPNPITPVTNSNTPVCVGGTINLSAASNAGASYSWTGPNSFASVLQNPSRSNVVMADAGLYSVIATLNGCMSPAGSTTIVVNPAPFVSIYPLPSDTICQGTTVTFVALPANTGTSPSFKWTRNSSPAILGTGNTLVSSAINHNDIIRCEMTENIKCGTAFKDTSNEVKMTVLPWLTPSVSITCSPNAPLAPYETVIFTAHPVNGGNSPKYQWRKNLTDQIGANSYTWGTMQIDDKDSVSVLMISDYKCPQPKTAGSNSIKVIVLTGVDEVKGNNTLSLYPNPNNGSFTIKGNVNSNKEVTIQIVNAVGQLVYETKAFPKNKELREQVNVHLASGVYVLKIKTEPITTVKFKIE